jgi:hypothetical protein
MSFNKDSKKLEKQVFYNVSIREASIYYSKTFNQKTLLQEIASFGGLMNFMLRMINMFLAGFTRHAMNNSMIKKLYSQRKSKSQAGGLLEEDQEIDALSFFGPNSDRAGAKKKLVKEMTAREVFTHSYLRWWIYDCIFCPRCCCKEKRADRQWKDATSKLSKEIDLMEIIKNNRNTKMLLGVKTSRKQRELVKFFQEYTINSGDDHDDDKKVELSDSSSGDENLADKKETRIVKRNEKATALLSVAIPNLRDVRGQSARDEV